MTASSKLVFKKQSSFVFMFETKIVSGNSLTVYNKLTLDYLPLFPTMTQGSKTVIMFIKSNLHFWGLVVGFFHAINNKLNIVDLDVSKSIFNDYKVQIIHKRIARFEHKGIIWTIFEDEHIIIGNFFEKLKHKYISKTRRRLG